MGTGRRWQEDLMPFLEGRQKPGGRRSLGSTKVGEGDVLLGVASGLREGLLLPSPDPEEHSLLSERENPAGAL